MEYNYPKFTPEMKKTHTILIPNMAITQFRLLEYALRYDGYKCEILGNCGSAVAQLGLKYVHNDTCYPALLVIGQFLDALNSGKYEIGTPIFPEVKMRLANGKVFTVLAPAVSRENIYIQSVKLNGQPYDKSYITHEQIMNGDTLKFEMGNQPGPVWYK